MGYEKTFGFSTANQTYPSKTQGIPGVTITGSGSFELTMDCESGILSVVANGTQKSSMAVVGSVFPFFNLYSSNSSMVVTVL